MGEIRFLPTRFTTFPSKFTKHACYMVAHGEIRNAAEPLNGPVILRGQLLSTNVNVII